jgi:hypothetical protein
MNMKYIRAQNGMVLSVSQLIPPSKGSRHEPLSGSEIEIWRLNVITVHGQRHTYAVYTDMEHAISVFSNEVLPFVYGDKDLLLFQYGENADVHPAREYLPWQTPLTPRPLDGDGGPDDSA